MITQYYGSELFRGGGVCAPTFFGHAKFEVKNFQNFFIYRVLWTLNFLEGVSGHQVFLVMTNLRSNFFRKFLIYRTLLMLNFLQRGLGTNLFGHTKFEVKNLSAFFNLQSTVDAEFFTEGSRHQLFLVMLNSRSNFF